MASRDKVITNSIGYHESNNEQNKNFSSLQNYADEIWERYKRLEMLDKHPRYINKAILAYKVALKHYLKLFVTLADSP